MTDEKILEARKMLASLEGIFVEPASAASLAGFLQLAQKNYFPKGVSVVCTVTGNGLKDVETAIDQCEDVISLQDEKDLSAFFA